MAKKISFPIALAIILVLAISTGATAWWLKSISEKNLQISLPTPTSDETASPKTYRYNGGKTLISFDGEALYWKKDDNNLPNTAIKVEANHQLFLKDESTFISICQKFDFL